MNKGKQNLVPVPKLKKLISGTGTEINQVKKAFTLVELIVVITILAILGTIAFISLQGFSKDARNSTRSTDMANIEKVLDLYRIENGNFPEPSNSVQVTYSGSEVWTQGTFGDDTRKLLGSRGQISITPVDPLTGNEYTYSVLNTGNEMQLAGVFEGTLSSNLNQTNTTYAAGAFGTTKVTGNYNGQVAKVQSGATTYILAVPSIISGDKNLTDIITLIESRKLVYNKSRILPSSYTGTIATFDESLPIGNIVNTGSVLVYSTNDINDLKIEANQNILIDNLQQSYSGTVVTTLPSVEIISNSTDYNKTYVAQTIINTSVNPKVKVTAKNNTNPAGPNYSDCLSMTQDDVDTLNNALVDPDAYYGITNPLTKQEWCDLTEIEIVYSSVSVLPSQIGYLTNLTRLYMSGSPQTSIPSEIKYLTNLTHLEISSNQLTSLPSDIGKLTNLIYLEISSNQLTSIPSEIKYLTNLTGLFIYNNSDLGNLGDSDDYWHSYHKHSCQIDSKGTNGEDIKIYWDYATSKVKIETGSGGTLSCP